MSDTAVETPAPVEAPAPPVETPPADDATTSLTAHIEQFGPEGKNAPPEDDDAGKGRRRAARARAGAEDVPRIKELTKNWRTEEAKRIELEKEVETLRAASARPVQQQAPPPQKPAVASSAPPPAAGKPNPDDLTKYPFGTADPQYVEDMADWKYETRRAKEREEETAKAQQEAAEKRGAELRQGFQAQVETLKKKHADVDTVFAKTLPPLLDDGTLGQAFVFESDNGAEVAYHLLTTPAEVTRLAGITNPVKLFTELTQLGLRLASPSTGSTVTTGSVAGSPSFVAPRPPNPVRTGPMKTADELPDPDQHTVSQHLKHWGPKRYLK